MKRVVCLILILTMTMLMTVTAQGSVVTARQQEEPTQSSNIPKDEPVSTTGTVYGCSEPFQLDTASSEMIVLSEGEWDINDVQLIGWEDPVIQNGGTSSLVVRNSYVRGETKAQTVPLEEDPGDLLTAGSLCTTRATDASESIYLNSSVISRNGASLFTGNALALQESGQKELSLYTYGSEVITMDGGYGACPGLFCDLHIYGSHIQAAEIGIISEDSGAVTIGTIADGEGQEALVRILTQDDKDKRSDKQLPSVVEGGRSAVMVHSAGQPLRFAQITASKAILRTDRSLDKGVKYEPQKQAYIDHTAGSVILVRSAGLDMVLDSCEMVPDPAGTGYLIQTVCSKDVSSADAEADGETIPGIRITMQNMSVTGSIAHEDYQRDLDLVLRSSSLKGAVNEYDCEHWNQASSQEGFTDYCPDASFSTHHGVNLTLTEQAVWDVTKESHLSTLAIDPDCTVNGVIFVDGTEQKNVPGSVYEGNVLVRPRTSSVASKRKSAEPDQPETTTPPGEHVHNWVSNGGYPATCTNDGLLLRICTTCSEEYQETIPALGHDWQQMMELEPDCVNEGAIVYQCQRPGCGAYYEASTGKPALGHDWQLVSSVLANCTDSGEDVYICSLCDEMYTEYYPAWGHLPDTSTLHPMPGSESIYHEYYCVYCHQWVHEIHLPFDPCVCGYSGPKG